MDAFENLPPAVWALIAAAIVVGWLLAWGFGAYRKHRARKSLVGTVAAAGLDYFADVLVPDGMGSFFHLDFVLLTPGAILVIDLRDVSGNIFGGDQMSEWTVMDGSQRFTFTNPQGALYDRIAAVRAIVGEVAVEGRVVFTRRGKFPKGLPKWTLMVDSLKSEFPNIERAGLEGPYREQWQKLKDSVSPSAMNQARPLSVR